ncbi:hypothetical protein LCGC14_2949060, partial [marine sediment metagenome]
IYTGSGRGLFTMVEEIGTVIKSGGGKARVRINRSDKCSSCHGCLLAEGGKFLIIEVIDSFDTATGDRVKIETKAGGAAKSGFILYILPLISLFIGYISGSKLVTLLGGSASEGWGILYELMSESQQSPLQYQYLQVVIVQTKA